MTPTAFIESVRQYIAEHDLLPDGARVLAGVSGGVDSMTLAHVLFHLGYAVEAVHVNYGLRGADAEADEGLVRQWCAEQTLPVPLHVRHADAAARAEATGASVQETAREQRYSIFQGIAEAEGVHHVAVAHHRDDQAETVLLNLFRGSGPEGLAGMAPARPLHDGSQVHLVRPLLTQRRADIEAMASVTAIPWRTDASNTSVKYRRSVVRTEILPLIEAHFQGATEAIARAGDLTRAYVEHTLLEELETRFDACAIPCDTGGALDSAALQEQPVVWQQRLILDALARWCPGAPQTEALAAEVQGLIGAQVGRRVETGAGTVWRERGVLRFVPAASTRERAVGTPIAWGKPVRVPGGALRVDLQHEPPPALDTGTPHAVYADADRMRGDLIVRSWQPGDRFQPLGMAHTKKVSDFLTDAQVPPHQKAATLVLCSGDRIVWVVRHRLDHRARVRPGTRRYAKLTFHPHEKA